MESKVFSDFSGGWYGTLDPAKVPDNMFDGRNILRYRDGSLGPRGGLKTFNLGRTTSGRITGMHHSLHATKNLLYVDGTTIWSVNADNTGANAVNLGSMSGASNTPVTDMLQPFANFDSQYSFVSNQSTTSSGRLYRIDLNAGTITNIATSPNMALAFYGTRMIRPNALQILYSARLAPTSWPAANFITVSAKGSEIVYVTEFRNFLAILTRDGQWWALTGVPGVNDTLRRVVDSFARPAWISPFAVVPVQEGIYYLSPVNNYPGMFDGAKLTDYPNLPMTPESNRSSYASSESATAYLGVRAFRGTDPSSPAFLLPSPTNRLLLMHHGAWTLHEFDVNVGQAWTSDGRGRLFGFGPVQAGAGTPAYTVDLHHDRPAFVSDTHCQPGDNSTTPLDAYIILPERWSPSTEMWRVSEVVVDLVRWNTGSPVNNHLDVVVDSLGHGSQLDDGSQTKDWDQPGTLSPATDDGERDRVRFTFGEQGYGAGWRVSLRNIKGVAIRAVTVNYEVESVDGRLW